MAEFADGRLSVLVATTVVEVGVDVPAATIMVIEQAERFGLAQLHQLRGRVGRGKAESACVLLYDPPLSEIAKTRLDILRRTDDGFLIAEKDLELRGGGDPLGLKQSGFPAYRLADPVAHRDLIAAAADDARLVLARDPELTSDRGRAVALVQELFDWRPGAAPKRVEGPGERPARRPSALLSRPPGRPRRGCSRARGCARSSRRRAAAAPSAAG